MIESGAYIFTVCAAVAFLSFISHLRADNKTVKAALGIIFISAIISPVAGLIDGIFSIDFDYAETPPEGGDGYAEYMEEAMREGIELAIMERFSIDADDITVKIENFGAEKMRAGVCRVTLSGAGSLSDYRGIEAYCLSLGADKCEVILFK